MDFFHELNLRCKPKGCVEIGNGPNADYRTENEWRAATGDLPCLEYPISDLEHIQWETQRDLKQIDQKWLMQELASAHRARDYINHVEMKTDPWIVTAQFDGIAIASWIQNAERFFPALG